MFSCFRCLARTYRAIGYLCHDRTRVEVYFLEATENNRDGPTEIQKITAARLTYDDDLFLEVKKALMNRMTRPNRNMSTLKAVMILDYAVRCGDSEARTSVTEFIPILEELSSYENETIEDELASQLRECSTNLITILRDDDVYSEARAAAESVLEKIQRVPINVSPERSHRGGQYSGISRSPQKAAVLDVMRNTVY